MNMNMRNPLLAVLAATASCMALAKLPAATPEAQAKAAEAAAKAAWNGKVDAYQLCQAQDKVAARFRQKEPEGASVSGCMNPGPFAYTPPADKPAEAAGAHSPPGTASSPPSTSMPSASAPKP